MYYIDVENKIVNVRVYTDGKKITKLSLRKSYPDEDASENSNLEILKIAKKQIQEFFDGKRVDFDLPLKISGTSFQEKVWKELLKIPYGETISYGELAKRVGNPKASRAVGGANNKNSIGLIIPCHRVIGASGKLTGYAAGVDVKSKLLSFEKSNTNNQY